MSNKFNCHSVTARAIRSAMILIATAHLSTSSTSSQAFAADVSSADRGVWGTEVLAANESSYAVPAQSGQSQANATSGAPSESERSQEASSPYPLQAGQPATAGSTDAVAPLGDDTDLAKRVEALEAYIRQMKAAGAAEPLPAPKTSAKDDK